jgi:peroxiredoxin
MNPLVLVRWLCLSIAILAGTHATGTPSDSTPRILDFSWWTAQTPVDLNHVQIPAPQDWIALVFLDPDCPVANAYIPVLNALAAQFKDRGVQLIGVYADPVLSPEQLQKHGRDFSITFPVTQDQSGHLVRLVGATYSSEVAVMNGKGATLYRGRIDNRITENGSIRPQATKEDLREILERLCSGETGPFPGQRGFGCFLPEPAKSQ